MMRCLDHNGCDTQIMVSLKRFTAVADVATTILVAIAALVFLWTQVESRWLNGSRRAQPQNVHETIAADKIRHAKGTAVTALIEFTDYECPFCGVHARTTAPQIEKDLVDTGIVRYALVNFPLERIHGRARKAGEAVECAARYGRYWEMHRRLFENQRAFGDEALAEAGASVGIEAQTFKRCLDGEMRDRITDDVAEGLRLRVSATPTFFVGIVQTDGSIQLRKRVSGTVSFDDLRQMIDAVRAMTHPSS